MLLFKQGKIPENWYYGNSVQTVFESRANCSGKTGVTGTECRQTSGFDLILTEFCQHGAAGLVVLLQVNDVVSMITESSEKLVFMGKSSRPSHLHPSVVFVLHLVMSLTLCCAELLM